MYVTLSFFFQFLQSYHKMSLTKVTWLVLRVKYVVWVTFRPLWFIRQGEAELHTLQNKARWIQAMYIETHFSVSSPLQSRSQAVVCVSTPRMYPQSRYFLVYYNPNKPGHWLSIQGPPYIFAPLLTFLKFFAPLLRRSRTNHASIESPKIGLFESWRKLGNALSWGWSRPRNWKSNNCTKTRLEPSMTDLSPISKLVSYTTIQGFLKRYITLSWVSCLRNSEFSNFNEEKVFPPLSLKLILSLSWNICFQFHNFFQQSLLRSS